MKPHLVKQLGKDNHESCADLWLAVLLQGIKDIVEYEPDIPEKAILKMSKTKAKMARVVNERNGRIRALSGYDYPEKWFYDKEGSFFQICDDLRLDPESIIQRVKQIRSYGKGKKFKGKAAAFIQELESKQEMWRAA